MDHHHVLTALNAFLGREDTFVVIIIIEDRLTGLPPQTVVTKHEAGRNVVVEVVILYNWQL